MKDQLKLDQVVQVTKTNNDFKFPINAIYRIVGTYLEGYGNQSIFKIHGLKGAKKDYSNQYLTPKDFEQGLTFRVVEPKKLYAYSTTSGEVIFKTDRVKTYFKASSKRYDRSPDNDLILHDGIPHRAVL